MTTKMKQPWTRSTKFFFSELWSEFENGTLNEFINNRLKQRFDFEEHKKIYMRMDDYDESLVLWQLWEWEPGEEFSNFSYFQQQWSYILCFEEYADSDWRSDDKEKRSQKEEDMEKGITILDKDIEKGNNIIKEETVDILDWRSEEDKANSPEWRH